MDRRILPAAPAAIPGNANGSPSHPGQPYLGGHLSNEDDAHGVKNSGRSGAGTKRRTKKDGEVDGGDDDDGAKKKKSKRRKVDHACVYCRSVSCFSFSGVMLSLKTIRSCRADDRT
jgi:transcription activator of gluconeogenesis